ncbi:MAG: LysR family transcriptional regulator [Reyranellaceae bacterium]
MNLRQIEAFLSVFEEGTFSAGAARLKVSQPTVSKLVDSLERGLGYKLFRRAGARVTPTDQGFALYRDMTRVKRGFDFLLHQAQGLKGQSEGGGRLVVGAGSALCGTLAPRLIARFRARHPAVHVTLEADGARYLIEQHVSGTIDIFLETSTTHAKEFNTGVGSVTTHRFAEGEVVCVVPSGHRLAKKRVIEFADLAGESYVGITANVGSRREIDDGLAASARTPARLVAEASTPAAACSLVGQGVGVTMVSDLSALTAGAGDRRCGFVCRTLRPAIGYGVGIAVSPASHNAPLAELFRQLTVEEGPALHRELVAMAGLSG